MNIFKRLIARERAADFRLGMPAADAAARERRMNAMASLNPAGFRQPKREPKTDAQGRTRGDRKRAARARANAKVSEARADQFMHSGALRQRQLKAGRS